MRAWRESRSGTEFFASEESFTPTKMLPTMSSTYSPTSLIIFEIVAIRWTPRLDTSTMPGD